MPRRKKIAADRPAVASDVLADQNLRLIGAELDSRLPLGRIPHGESQEHRADADERADAPRCLAPAAQGRALYDAANEPRKLIILQGAGHDVAGFAGDSYLDAVAEFIRQALVAHP